MRETEKTRAVWTDFERKILALPLVLDIGFGGSLVVPHAIGFDKEQGDANYMMHYFKPHSFDVVYSSHTLEDMYDPEKAIIDWWRLVKPGGYLFIIVPDEDLYEQGHWPSKFNPDHKWTFTTKTKVKSWSPVSISVLNLAAYVPDRCDIKIKLQTQGYQMPPNGTDQTLGDALAQIQLIVQKIQ